MIKAAIFDMDGLLIDSEPFWQQAQREALATVGIEITQVDLHFNMGRRINEVIAYYYHKQPWQGPSQADIVALVTDKVITMIKQQGCKLPGVDLAIMQCQTAGLELAIASSSSPEIINAVVDTLGLREQFSHLYSADNEAFGKPHPSVFISTAELLRVQPLECLVFEDSPAGVLAAKAAQMTCIAVPEDHVRDHRFIQTADRILDSLEQFDESVLAELSTS